MAQSVIVVGNEKVWPEPDFLHVSMFGDYLVAPAPGTFDVNGYFPDVIAAVAVVAATAPAPLP